MNCPSFIRNNSKIQKVTVWKLKGSKQNNETRSKLEIRHN